MSAPLRIRNRDARRLWLDVNGLAETPTGPLDVAAIIRRLGFVQIDTIRNVTRAHNHILWSRNQNYREGMLWPLLERDRAVFEHFTHDASLIPMEVLPYWQRQFRRLGEKAAAHEWYRSGLGRDQIAAIRDRIAREGALSTHAFDTTAASREMWARPPHKKALDQMWYAGELATAHRRNFVKYYDLAERVFPARLGDAPADAEQVDWLCRAALDRIGIGSPGEVQRFWAAATAREVRDWCAAARYTVRVEVEGADGRWTAALAAPDIETRLSTAPAPTSRLRILNPFDPAVRDRNRLERLFGFDYRNEMFVPASKRRWGYYVYPLLEADRFVGRIEVKADRARDLMRVTGFWPEPRVRWGTARHEKLAAELARFARLAGVRQLQWEVAALT
ncbi:winged helix DNA-binding domain-containing protein [Roseovarius sp. SCSIO 43702]|uniref:winged helix-turn-helix domain-containing protein n=1 Tax=Roseovarius sp. SCSIO 43702 TaxID=2823043 RepID=UPI001C735BED|nr:crosslink repair DNA glycosylase YcaQ family protein [Roseovarius sp. SCSIO 43702]QYX57425.1 winged helix DNA-binding domain-containing protein [Roseovarius sp. SCSIO 43702]